MNNSLASTREYNSSPFFCESANYKKYDLRDDLSSRLRISATSTTRLLCKPIHPFHFENIVVLVNLLTCNIHLRRLFQKDKNLIDIFAL